MLLIANLCQEHDVLAITDEVYEHIVYRGATHRRLATLPGMWERTLTLSSGGKSFSCTGWKIGWAIGPAPLQNALRRVHQFTVFASTTPMGICRRPRQRSAFQIPILRVARGGLSGAP